MLGEIRRVKSVEKRPMKARISVADVAWDADTIRLLQQVEPDLRAAAGVGKFTYAAAADRLSLSLAFAEEEAGSGEARA